MGEISYERFGANFVQHVVTPERIAATIARVSGGEVKAGPMAAGPGGAASVTATGSIGEIEVRVASAKERLAFEAVIPIDLQLDVRVAAADHRYRGRVRVPLHLRVRAVEPVTLIIDVDPVLSDKVEVELSATGMRAKFLQRLGGMDDEVRRAVAGIVNERLASEPARDVRNLDILSFVDRAWNPGPPDALSEG